MDRFSIGEDKDANFQRKKNSVCGRRVFDLVVVVKKLRLPNGIRQWAA